MEINVEEQNLSVVLKEAKFDVVISAEAPLHVNVGESAKIDVGQAIDYIKSGEAEIEAAVTAGTNAFNANATAKTNAFNQNATDKTTAYNNNASAKTQDYNDNATAKLNAYNQNATDKTNAFNSNATDKITDFNDNASDKTLEFNENAAEKQAEVDASAALAKQYAIGEPTEPTGNSAKYWAEQAASELSGLTSRVTTIEGKIPSDASSSNQLADKAWVGNQGYITGITSGDVTTALGYTPYDASNPNGYQTASDVQTAIAGKQDTLVSGTNIKTINNNSIIGSGDLTIDGLPSQTGQNGKFLTTDGTEASWADVGGGLEIGDIGFAPLGVDEAQNKRRYLNGQVISQTQFASFTNKIKTAIQLNPSLATSETNWQAEVTNSPYGICGKFVIDDTLGTIRLPKYPDWSIREIGQVAVVGNGMTLGLTNGTTNVGLGATDIYHTDGGLISNTANYGEVVGANGGTNGNITPGSKIGVTTDPTKSGVIADLVNANTEDKLQGKWFIQVATGVEESIDVTREIELNNPFSLLDYKWSEYELNNASWLLSNGQFNSGATYVSVYELLLKIYNGTETKDGVSVKLSTEAYTDTDFVINTANATFRLPIKVKLASGNAVVGNGMNLGMTDGTDDYGFSNQNTFATASYANLYGQPVGTAKTGSAIVNDKSLGITQDPTKSGIETSSSGLKLYFYVGETIQDANIIAASQVLTTVADCVRKSSLTDRETVVSWGMPDYTAGISIAVPTSSAPYTAPCSGIYIITYQGGKNTSGKVLQVNGGNAYQFQYTSAANPIFNGVVNLDKCDVLSSDTTSTPSEVHISIFYPFKGAN